MTENNAAQPLLTDDEIKTIRDRLGGGFLGPVPFARAIESALLSKLRAEGVPVAVQAPIKLSAAVLEYLKEGVENATQCEEADVDQAFADELLRLMHEPLYAAPVASAPADERAAFKLLEAWQAVCDRIVDQYGGVVAGVDFAALGRANRAALASAPVADIKDWRIDTSAGGPILVYKNCSVIESEQAEYVLRLVAADQESASVAGEARPVAYCQPNDPINSSAFSWPGLGRKKAHTVPLYTAPQASAEYERGHAAGWAAGWDQAIKPQAREAVRNQALEEAAHVASQNGHYGNLLASSIRALKQPQADKGGCPHPRAFRSGDKQGYVCQDCGAFESDYEIHRRQQRAALSATQTEQGERDE